MMSSQRLLLIVIGINLIIGLVSTIWLNPATYNEDILSNENALYEAYVLEVKDDDPYSGVTNRDFQQETSIGNSISLGSVIWDIFTNSLVPWSIRGSHFTNSFEQIAANALVFFRSTLGILLFFDLIIMVIKNRKTS